MEESRMPPFEPLAVDLRTAAKMLGVTRSTIYRGIQNGAFPKPTLRMGTMSPRWSLRVLKDFLAAGGVRKGEVSFKEKEVGK